MQYTIISGDLHLKPKIWTKYNNIAGDAFSAYRQVLNYAKQYNASLCLAGDVFDDAYPNSESIAVFSEILSLNKPVFFIQGQHDMSQPPWISALTEQHPDQFIHVHKKLFNPFGNAAPLWYGIDCQTSKDELQTLLANVPKEAQILLLHQLVDIAMGINPSMEYTWIPPHIQCCFMGDLHEPVEITNKPCKIYYTGSTYLCRRGEPLAKSCLLVGEDGSIQRLPLKSRKFVVVTFGDEVSVDNFINNIETISKSPEFLNESPDNLKTVVFLRYNAVDSKITSRLIDIHKLLDTYNLITILEPTLINDTVVASTNTLEPILDIYAIIAKLLDKNSNAYKLAEELLRSNETQRVFLTWKEKYITG